MIVKEPTHESILETMKEMYKKQKVMNTLMVSMYLLEKIKQIPQYNSDYLYGRKVIDNECGNIEALVVVEIDTEYDYMYITGLKFNL